MSGDPAAAGALVLAGVSIASRDGRNLVDRLDLTVPPGMVATVMGPSGIGKSTLLAYVAGFIDRRAFAAEGQVMIGHERIDAQPAEARHVGILFQDPVLFPHLSVAGNLLFGLPRGRWRSRAERRGKVSEALEQAGLAGFEDRDPATLSGGQKARVSLLRTLLAEPRALLLDEPFGKLDAALRADIRAFVFAHARERGLPALLVTHDAEDAEAAGGPVVALAGPGVRLPSG
ncbi:ATP-binding cassette domain-containing protein [Chelatococcus daeguensis]|uniref:ATP-binding cassette domain-containing protein n=1 Tax=Chelatococcus daeguensis TaxID=444444 RepID=UPI0007ABF7E7|nr:ATP-binding cassette domain-containing protein [Chelatococcus daeguensis]KZE30526.1 ABC transporter ATP-binding protein [Chelatococcus daeguensis]MBM3081871.1 ATP-binding cassette domain-containing protein [Chelatococcus daeguensis]